MNTSLRLSVIDLAVSRGERLLFKGLNFSVASGEILSISGPNGIGKTTLLRAIAGFLRPETGRITLDGLGRDQQRASAMHFVGYRDGLKAALTVRENLLLAPLMFQAGGLSLDAAAETLDLARLLDLPVGALSSGQRRRAAVARLLMAERPIWLLDEPTATLDAASTAKVSEILSAHAARGGMVIAATHLPLGVTAQELAFQPDGGFVMRADA